LVEPACGFKLSDPASGLPASKRPSASSAAFAAKCPLLVHNGFTVAKPHFRPTMLSILHGYEKIIQVNLTDYHAKYFAHELTKRCSSDSLEKLAGAVAGAQVDLNPHQVDAALFAFNSPLSKGALLADEVGLGKTIEAGIVISQRWAERKRWILVIVPSNLRKQWYQELAEKFFLPCQLLETKFYNAAIRQGNFRPFELKDCIVICSYQFARKQAADVANIAPAYQKVGGSRSIGPHLDPVNNRSHSFGVFVAGIRKLAAQ
jgi:adenine-specific DNA-methyltransferase